MKPAAHLAGTLRALIVNGDHGLFTPVASIGLLLVALIAVACVAAPSAQEGSTPTVDGLPSPGSQHPGASTVAFRSTVSRPTDAAGPMALPAPRMTGSVSLEEALAHRRSVREFSETPLVPAELGQLLWAAQGITSQDGRRTAPSAGALYPLEVYAVTAEATYHYEPQGHQLSVHLKGDRRQELYASALQQAPVLQAPTVLVIAAVYERTAGKYGEARTPRYVHLEAGHAAQNILLQAVALGLGAVPVGAFYDDQVQAAMRLPPDQQPLYLIPTGHPR